MTTTPANLKPDTTNRRPIVERGTVVPLAMAAGVVVVAAASAWSVAKSMTEVVLTTNYRFERIDERLELLSKQLEEAGADRWRRGDMRQWAELLRAQNPNINIPKVQ